MRVVPVAVHGSFNPSPLHVGVGVRRGPGVPAHGLHMRARFSASQLLWPVAGGVVGYLLAGWIGGAAGALGGYLLTRH